MRERVGLVANEAPIPVGEKLKGIKKRSILSEVKFNNLRAKSSIYINNGLQLLFQHFRIAQPSQSTETAHLDIPSFTRLLGAVSLLSLLFLDCFMLTHIEGNVWFECEGGNNYTELLLHILCDLVYCLYSC